MNNLLAKLNITSKKSAEKSAEKTKVLQKVEMLEARLAYENMKDFHDNHAEDDNQRDGAKALIKLAKEKESKNFFGTVCPSENVKYQKQSKRIVATHPDEMKQKDARAPHRILIHGDYGESFRLHAHKLNNTLTANFYVDVNKLAQKFRTKMLLNHFELPRCIEALSKYSDKDSDQLSEIALELMRVSPREHCLYGFIADAMEKSYRTYEHQHRNKVEHGLN